MLKCTKSNQITIQCSTTLHLYNKTKKNVSIITGKLDTSVKRKLSMTADTKEDWFVSLVSEWPTRGVRDAAHTN